MTSAEAGKSLAPGQSGLSQRDYREFLPGPFLATSVECFWTGTQRIAPRKSSLYRVLPDKCMDLLFDFTPVENRRAFVIGTMTQPLVFTRMGSVDLIGVRFRPGCLPAFLSLNAAEIADGRVDLADYWGRFAHEVWHRLIEADPAHRVRLLEELLSSRAKGGIQGDPFISHCVARMETAKGHLRIGDLEKSTGLSARQLERKFARHLGISPKTFARIVRFKGVLAAVNGPEPVDWVRLAGDFGFADQPHLIREFKALSGLTPVDYRAASNTSP